MNNSSHTCGCECNQNGMFLEIPNTDKRISPGCKVRLGRFNDDTWTVNFGWFSFSGNRPMCGWYFTSDDGEKVKPILLTDLDDIYMIEHQANSNVLINLIKRKGGESRGGIKVLNSAKYWAENY